MRLLSSESVCKLVALDKRLAGNTEMLLLFSFKLMSDEQPLNNNGGNEVSALISRKMVPMIDAGPRKKAGGRDLSKLSESVLRTERC